MAKHGPARPHGFCDPSAGANRFRADLALPPMSEFAFRRSSRAALESVTHSWKGGGQRLGQTEMSGGGGESSIRLVGVVLDNTDAM